MKCFVTFRLKEGITPDEYERWFRETNVPAVRKMRSISSYRVWRASGAMEGEVTWDYLEEMELDDQAAFERETEELPEMAAMLEGWYSLVTEQSIVYGVEVTQNGE